VRVAILALLIFAFSLLLFTNTEITTVFVSQHSFVNLTKSKVDCAGCHRKIQDELNKSAIHSDLSCESCHRFNLTFAEVRDRWYNYTVGEEAHAAFTPRCLDCHGGNGTYLINKTGQTVYAPPAKAFNESNYGSDYSAHKRLVLKANDSNLSFGENEACLVCHTNYSSSISYSYFYNLNYTLTNWEFTNFTYNGTRTYNVQWKKSGSKHEFLDLDEIECTKCHRNIYEALVNGTSGVDEDYLTHSPIEIDDESWDTTNPWNHSRYHYIPPANRSSWVNKSYCIKCHNVDKYADENPNQRLTYELDNVTSDTNSTKVHCAEILTCQTCHGTGKTKEVIDNPDQAGTGHGSSFVDNVTYARTFNGDVCMGCHEAAVHPTLNCDRCHTYGNATVYIESEPSGYAQND